MSCNLLKRKQLRFLRAILNNCLQLYPECTIHNIKCISTAGLQQTIHTQPPWCALPVISDVRRPPIHSGKPLCFWGNTSVSETRVRPGGVQASLRNSGTNHSKDGLVGGKGPIQHLQSSGFGLSHCGKTLALFPLKVKYIWSLNLLAMLQLTTHGVTVFVGEQ